MLSRSSAVIISLTSLSAGIVLGILLHGEDPSSRLRSPARDLTSDGLTSTSGSLAKPLSRQELEATRTYDVLAKQYEQFQHVNRTFELVAKAVSPSVVHIVAQKPCEPRRVRGHVRSRKPARVSSSVATASRGSSF